MKTENAPISDDNSNQPKMRIGTDDFKTLLLNSEVFVDKSLLIKEVIEDIADVILVTRPRRWGKSLNMDMLKKFLEIEVDEQGNPLPLEKRVNHKLFAGGEVDLGFDEFKTLKPLKIASYETAMKQQGQHPVILINFKDVKGSSYQDIEQGVRGQITGLFSQYRYLRQHLSNNNKVLDDQQKEKLEHYLKGKLDKHDLKGSLRFLSELLFKHFNQKVYILIDEYDTPINSSYLKFGDKPAEFEQVLELFRGLMGSALKSNPYLAKGMITGILRIAKANLFSDLNNVTEYTLLDRDFCKFYGFTQAEVDELLLKVPTVTPTEKIKDWYNGYTFGGEIIYNPWSIMQCLGHQGRLDYYWLDSGGTGLIDKALLSDEIQEDLQLLASGQSIISPISKQISFNEIEQPVGLFSLLLFSGYLNPKEKEPEENIYELSAPNKEVRYIYKARMLQWVTDQLKIDRSRYYSFVSLLPAGKVEEFKERLQELLLNSTSFHQTGSKKAELFYSGLMLGLINTLSPSYIIESERESGIGRPDIVLVPKAGKADKAIIIEYKSVQDSKDMAEAAVIGLNQIINKLYDTKLKELPHVKQIIKIAMVFCGKEVEIKYQVDE